MPAIKRESSLATASSDEYISECLDEQQSRWYMALESQKIGQGGDTLLSQITGMNVETIRRGRQELDEDLHERPTDHIRTAGGGQPSAEKKTYSSRRH